MSIDTDDPLEARVARLEGSVSQMNERLGSIERQMSELQEDMRSLRTDVTDLRASMRNWAVFVVLALGTLITIVGVVL